MVILGDGEAGLPLSAVCRKHAISIAGYYKWKGNYAGVSANEHKLDKELEAESSRLKRMNADLALKNAAIKDVLSRQL